MRSMNHCLLAALIALFVAVMISCVGCDASRSPPSAVEHFTETQANTMTPHGRVNPHSVQDLGDGYLQYETDDGSNWRTRYTPTGNGYRYSDVERLQ